MMYIAFTETSLDGNVTRHEVIGPAGDVVCTTAGGLAAEALARILNTHGGKVFGKPVMEWDWAHSNGQKHDAA